MNTTRLAALLAEARKHMEQGKFSDAAGQCRLALRRDPRSVEAHALLGDALQHQGQCDQAITSYRHALRLQPGSAAAWWGLGCAYRTLGDHADAVPALRRLLEVAPDDELAWHNLGVSLHELGRTEEAIDALRESVRLNASTVAMSRGSIATIIPGDPRADHTAVLNARRQWASELPNNPRPDPPGLPDRPIRLGYVSSFFKDRNWMKPVWGVINRHDREHFEVHLFSEGPQDAIRHGYQPDSRDHFHDFRGVANSELADRIRAAGIDVLIDLNGYSRLHRLPVYAARSAPVQLGWFNLYATSGVPGLDYLLGDADVIRPEEEALFSEQVIRLPRCYLTYEVTYPVPDVTPPPCHAGEPFTFGCLAPQYKVTQAVLDAWAAILHRAANSRLVLQGTFLGRPNNVGHLREEFARRGVAADRIRLLGPAEHFTFLQTYSTVDLALDTFPYNGGTTTMEALWQGVPVLCFHGDRWAARIGASMMRSAGLPDFVAGNVGGYVDLAVALANDPATPGRLAALRSEMRERVRASRLGDVTAFTRELESVYSHLLCGEPTA